jgi:hypothetical protein
MIGLKYLRRLIQHLYTWDTERDPSLRKHVADGASAENFEQTLFQRLRLVRGLRGASSKPAQFGQSVCRQRVCENLRPEFFVKPNDFSSGNSSGEAARENTAGASTAD